MEESEREPTQLTPLWKFDRTKGGDEMNLAEWPLAAMASRVPEGQKTLTFERRVRARGTGEWVSRKLTISGSDQYGLPTAIDNDVLLALIHLTKCRNGFTERSVNLSRYELVRFLQWDDCGKSYRRLEKSLNVLASVTLFYNQAWWDKGGKSWRNRTFHILESVELRGRDSRGESEQPTSSITWNGIVFESFTAHYIKNLNLKVYFELKGPARQAYRFLDKRFYHKRRLEFDLRTFAFEHLGFSRSYDTGQLKRKLEPMLKELERVGFLKPMTRDERFVKRGPGDWTIRVEHLERRETVKLPPAAEDDITHALVDRGVTRAVAEELSASFPIEEIERQVVAFDAIMKKRTKRISNPPGFLVRAIRGSYLHPKEPAEKTKPIQIAAPLPLPIDPDREEREEFWKMLSADEKCRLEQEAFEKADSFLLDGWKRATDSNAATLAQGYRQTILDQHLQRVIARMKEIRKAS